MKIYNYLFFRLYKFFFEINNEMPSFLTIMALCWLFLINSFTVFGFIFIQNTYLANFYTKSTGIISTVLILAGHYFYFHYKNRYKKIIEYYESKESKTIPGTIIILLYIFLTFFIFFKYIVPNIAGIIA